MSKHCMMSWPTRSLKESAWCLRHAQLCPITPRHSVEFQGRLWVEGSGSTCCPWSPMGQRTCWLDSATLPFFVWAYSTRFYEPDAAIHECVPGFPEEILQHIFSPLAGHAVPKSPFARACPDPQMGGYVVRTLKWSPTDLGIPSNRPRKYTSMHLRSSLTSGTIDELDIPSIFYRQLRADASVYFAAPASVQRLEFEEVAAKAAAQRSPERVVDDPVVPGLAGSSAAMLSSADYVRLEGYMVTAQNRGLCRVASDGESSWFGRRVAIANIAQTPGHGDIKWRAMPALLRRSKLVNLVDGRFIFAAEHWLVQGFPHPAFPAVDDGMKKYFPCTELVADGILGSSDGSGSGSGAFSRRRHRPLASSAQRVLTGNAMHWAQIGIWFLVVLAQGPWNIDARTDST